MRSGKLRFCSQVTDTWHRAPPGFSGPTMVCTELVRRTVSWQTWHATAPATTGKTGQHGGGVSLTGGTTGGAAGRTGLAAAITSAVGATHGTGGTGDREHRHHPRPSGETSLLSLPAPSAAIPAQGYSFHALPHPTSRYRNEAITLFSSRRPSQVVADYKISGSKFSPSWHILKMLMTTSVSCFQR